VQRDAESSFARIECAPTASVAGADTVLVLDKPPAPAPRPSAELTAEPVASKKRR